MRVAAMHSLIELSRSREEMLQSVTSVICAYLRRPFMPPLTDSGDKIYDEALNGAQREELTVRRAAQRLLNQALQEGATGKALDVDLTGATVDRLDFGGKHLGQLLCHDMTVLGTVDLSDAIVEDTASFSRSHFLGDFNARSATFKGNVWFSLSRFMRKLNADGARITGAVTFTRSTCKGPVSLQGITCEGYFGMSRVNAASGIVLDKARLLGHADFSSANIRHRTALNSVTLDGPSLNMQKAKCQHFEFHKIAVGSDCSIKPPHGWLAGGPSGRPFERDKAAVK
ncbi:hypothetical protein GCM10009756_18770 [Pseudokineococcus marinus]